MAFVSIVFKPTKHVEECHILNQLLFLSLFQINVVFIYLFIFIFYNYYIKFIKIITFFTLYIDNQSTNTLRLQTLKEKIKRNFNKVKNYTWSYCFFSDLGLLQGFAYPPKNPEKKSKRKTLLICNYTYLELKSINDKCKPKRLCKHQKDPLPKTLSALYADSVSPSLFSINNKISNFPCLTSK